ncbi:Mss4-like protein [Microdochium bolleyi]|uniref:Mss4-like protein n=1 Tax=Microdochium bolleyi TaxID=196109 RepID=A0A136JHG9_9PEZI|nr:Mss4-like protein [Microdochium bolleyi]
MASTNQTQEQEAKKSSETYTGGCHCGYIKYSVVLSPPLYEREVNNCNCSVCVRLGYLLLYPEDKDLTWLNGSFERMSRYRFNTKNKDQLFCPKCGTSLAIDFRDCLRERLGKRFYGLSARTIDNVQIGKLNIRDSDGLTEEKPAVDTGGTWWDEEKQEMR